MRIVGGSGGIAALYAGFACPAWLPSIAVPRTHIAIPAQAEIHLSTAQRADRWILACAGMAI